MEACQRPALRQVLCRDFFDLLRSRVARGIKADERDASTEDAAAQYDVVQQKIIDNLRHVLKIYGWPGKTMVGIEGQFAACNMALLSDSDLPLQKQCLEHMRQAGSEEAPPAFVAKLTDRILVAEKRPQVYGTQFRVDTQGIYGPAPIADESGVDIRRASVGLGTLAQATAEAIANKARWSAQGD